MRHSTHNAIRELISAIDLDRETRLRIGVRILEELREEPRNTQPEIYVVVTDRDMSRPSPNSSGPIVMETPVCGATLEAATEKAATVCQTYGEAHIARLEFVGNPIVRTAPRPIDKI